MVRIERLWPGSTVVCIATGPSLCAEDVDYVRGKARVIAVNDGYRLAPWADVLYSSDHQWWPRYKGVPAFTGPKYCVARSGRNYRDRDSIPKHPEVQMLRNTGTEGVEKRPDALRTIRNSGGAAINLAIHFGAVRILLLGYNMGHDNGKAHFFGNHAGLPNDSHNYQTFIRLFQTMAHPLKDMGVTVINCSRVTRLTAFPCKPLREALPESSEVAA